MITNTTSPSHSPCPYCCKYHDQVCPLVKAIEYNPDGSIKRIEFKTASDYMPAQLPTWMPGPITCTVDLQSGEKS